MTFTYTDELLSYMKEKKKETILFELIIANNSEFEIAELHVHLIDDKRAEDFIKKQGYGVVTTDHGRVLLPRYKLDIQDEVVLGLKKTLFIRSITHEGLKLMR